MVWRAACPLVYNQRPPLLALLAPLPQRPAEPAAERAAGSPRGKRRKEDAKKAGESAAATSGEGFHGRLAAWRNIDAYHHVRRARCQKRLKEYGFQDTEAIATTHYETEAVGGVCPECESS